MRAMRGASLEGERSGEVPRRLKGRLTPFRTKCGPRWSLGLGVASIPFLVHIYLNKAQDIIAADDSTVECFMSPYA